MVDPPSRTRCADTLHVPSDSSPFQHVVWFELACMSRPSGNASLRQHHSSIVPERTHAVVHSRGVRVSEHT